MANESLGQIECSGCDGTADIKRRTNGKRLLYLHCKNCGLDQRSGAKLQAKWQAIIDGINSPVATTQANEWQPEERSETENDNEQQRNNNEQNENSESGWLKWGFVGAIIVAISKFARV